VRATRVPPLPGGIASPRGDGAAGAGEDQATLTTA